MADLVLGFVGLGRMGGPMSGRLAAAGHTVHVFDANPEALAAAARAQKVPVLVLAGQVRLDGDALRSAGILAALAMADYAGSVRLALADAANQLMGLASEAAARLGNSATTRYL